MMAYATSVDIQDTLPLIVTGVSLRMHHVLLLTVRRVVETVDSETVISYHLLFYLAMPITSMLKRLGRNQLSC